MHRRRPTSPVLDPLWLQPVPAGSRRVRSRRADGRGLVAYGTWYCELGSELGTSAPCPWCMYPRPMRPRVLVRHLSEGSHSSYSSAHLHHASYTAGGPFVCLAPVPTPAPSCSPPHTHKEIAPDTKAGRDVCGLLEVGLGVVALVRESRLGRFVALSPEQVQGTKTLAACPPFLREWHMSKVPQLRAKRRGRGDLP